MKNKITKTIIAIVFVMFLKINNVNAAADIITKCEYDLSSKDTIYININSGYTIQTIEENGVDANSKYTNINWLQNIGISGYEYYRDHGQKCPPKMYYIKYRVDRALFFSDADKQHMKEIETYAASDAISTYFAFWEIDDGISETKWMNLSHQTDNPLPTHGEGETPADGEEEEEKHYDDPEVSLVVTPYNPSLSTYSCGNNMMTGIPNKIPKVGKFIYNFLTLLVPLVVVILGSIDLVKAITGGKEDEIKKGQQVFIKRLIAGLIIFFAFAITKTIISIVAYNSTNVISCINCFIKADGSCDKEY